MENKGSKPELSKRQHGSRFVRHEIKKLLEKNIGNEKICFVEPFAGHAWVSKEVCKEDNVEKCILGDIDPKALEFAKEKNLKNIDQNKLEFKLQDWEKTVEENKNCIFFIDPPYYENEEKALHNLFGGKENPGKWGFEDFYPKIVEKCKNLKCIIQAPPDEDKKELLCKEFKCYLFEILQGQHPKTKEPFHFKYLIATKIEHIVKKYEETKK